MPVASYIQTTNEVKIYTLDYGSDDNTDPFLTTGESLTGTPTVTVTPTTSPVLTVASIALALSNKGVTFIVSGGTSGTKYKLVIRVGTTIGQYKEVVEYINVRTAS